MTTATPAQVRAGIASYIAAHVTYLDFSGVSQPLKTFADGERVPSPPCAVVLPASGQYLNYQVAMGGQFAGWDGRFRILILISKGDVENATPLLDGFLSPHGSPSTSIVQALLADPTCGGAADFVTPIEASWSGSGEWAGQEYMTGQILLEAGAE